MTRRPPSSSLNPSTTLFRSLHGGLGIVPDVRRSLIVLRASHEGLDGLGARSPGADLGRGGVVEARAMAVEAHVARRSEEHTSELQSRQYLVCRLLLEIKNIS